MTRSSSAASSTRGSSTTSSWTSPSGPGPCASSSTTVWAPPTTSCCSSTSRRATASTAPPWWGCSWPSAPTWRRCSSASNDRGSTCSCFRPTAPCSDCSSESAPEGAAGGGLEREVLLGPHHELGQMDAGGAGDGPQHGLGHVLGCAQVLGHRLLRLLEHGVGEPVALGELRLLATAAHRA